LLSIIDRKLARNMNKNKELLDKTVAFIMSIYIAGIIKIITIMTIHCNRQWWSPQESILAAASFLLFFVLSALTLFHFMSAIFEGPGYLALKWMPVIY